MTIPLGIEFNDLEITLLAEQVKRMTVAVEYEVPQNKQEKKLNQLYLEAAQREIDQFRKQIEKVTNRKISEAETAEDKKAYLYKTIFTLTETKDAILWKNRELIKDLEEEYKYATNQALTLDKKDFEAMEEYEQRILIKRFARQIELCESEPLQE
ncbi:12734_t:CDS:2 [Racocetra persica]|uniref:12734_t:CDS:1 n=1 Tax=Racocetra persica TaxID=160502 RepID=A0ACA9KK06_9GLOM|nr:12734_t:CDS:2 [Racocetra persica]